MDAPSHLASTSLDPLTTELLARLASLYPKISPSPAVPDPAVPDFGAPVLELPPLDVLATRVVQSSFKVFDDPAAYFQSARAKEFVSWSTPRTEVYRIFFNSYSGKVYVDLNGKRWLEARSKLQEEILFCEILRTLIFVLTCEVELAEARDADNGSPEVVEVVIP